MAGRKKEVFSKRRTKREIKKTRTPPPALLRAEKWRIVYTDNRVDVELYLII